MNVHQFLMSVIAEYAGSLSYYNEVCDKLTDRMSYYNECVNSLTSIHARMETKLSEQAQESILNAIDSLIEYFVKNGQSSEDSEKIASIHEGILSSLWKMYNTGAINPDSVKLIGFPYTSKAEPLSANIISKAPGFTVTVYENVGRYSPNEYLKRSSDAILINFMTKLDSTNDPVYRNYFGMVPYLIPAYGTVDETQSPYNEPVLVRYRESLSVLTKFVKDGVSATSQALEDIEDVDEFAIEWNVRKKNAYFEEYYKSVMNFFYEMMDVYTDNQFSSGIFKV